MWEELVVVRISLSPEDAGPGESLHMKLVSDVRLLKHKLSNGNRKLKVC